MLNTDVLISMNISLIFISEGPINTLRPRQNGRHIADDIFKRIFFNENVWSSIEISLKFVPKGSKIPALFQIMAWRRPGDKPLSEAMLVSLLTHKCVTRPQWVNNIPALVQKTAWRRPGDSHYLNQRLSYYCRIYASLGLKYHSSPGCLC